MYAFYSTLLYGLHLYHNANLATGQTLASVQVQQNTVLNIQWLVACSLQLA